MRKREGEEKITTRRRYSEGIGVFGTHTQGVFGTSRRAGRWCRGRQFCVSRVVQGWVS